MLLLAIVGTNCILSKARSSKPYKYGVNWALFVVCVSQLLFGGVTTLREFYAATSFQLMLFLTSYTHRPASDSEYPEYIWFKLWPGTGSVLDGKTCCLYRVWGEGRPEIARVSWPVAVSVFACLSKGGRSRDWDRLTWGGPWPLTLGGMTPGVWALTLQSGRDWAQKRHELISGISLRGTAMISANKIIIWNETFNVNITQTSPPSSKIWNIRN